MSAKPIFETVALIGLGLVGASLARVIRRNGLARRVVGCDANAEARAVVERLAIVDAVHGDAAAAVAGADLVVLCTPIGAFGDIARAIGPSLTPGTIVSDVGSVKQLVFDDVAPHLPAGVHLVPGHPVAGTEHSGPEAGFADLFQDRWCILTPARDCDADALARVSSLWQRAGSTLEVMDAMHHDRVLAITSHLPHLIAYSIVHTAAELEGQLASVPRADDRVTTAEVIKFSAGGFRDFTRIAGSNPVMWRDVFLRNREPVLEMLGRFTEDLTALQKAIRWGEGEQLEQMFTHTRAIRLGVVEAGQAGLFDPREPTEATATPDAAGSRAAPDPATAADPGSSPAPAARARRRRPERG